MGIQQPRKMYEKRGGKMQLLPTALIPRPFDSAYFLVKGGESLLLPAEIDLLESWYDRSLLPSAHGMIGQSLMALRVVGLYGVLIFAAEGPFFHDANGSCVTLNSVVEDGDGGQWKTKVRSEPPPPPGGGAPLCLSFALSFAEANVRTHALS